MRETEAIKLWCPFTKAAWGRPDEAKGWVTSGDRTGFNRVLIRPGGAEVSVGSCCGSACMAWRNQGFTEVKREPEMVGLERMRFRITHERVGYCGLAGTPGPSDAELLEQAQEADRHG